MMETLLTEKKIIRTLNKKGCLDIEPICIDCIHDVIDILEENFASFNIHIESIEDRLYHMEITL